ncbi:unnamed protein product, partial [marine sediment metagenome]
MRKDSPMPGPAMFPLLIPLENSEEQGIYYLSF